MGEIGCNARSIYNIIQAKLFDILELYGIDGFERNYLRDGRVDFQEKCQRLADTA